MVGLQRGEDSLGGCLPQLLTPGRTVLFHSRTSDAIMFSSFIWALGSQREKRGPSDVTAHAQWDKFLQNTCTHPHITLPGLFLPH